MDENFAGLWLAYSQSGDPTAGWNIYTLGIGLPAGGIMDYPIVGQDQNAFIYNTNNFDGSGNYLNTTSILIPKARVYNGYGASLPIAGVNYNTAPAIVGGHPTPIVNNLYMLSPDDANNLMYVYAWTNTGEASAHVSYLGSIPYNWAAPPRRVNQPGTSATLDPLDGRIDWMPTQLDGKVWFAHGVDIGGYPGVNWGFVTPGNMSIHVGTAFETQTSDDFNPSISVQNGPNGVPQAWLTWAYDDAPNGVATHDVYAFAGGTTPGHVSGTVFGANGQNITNEDRFGDYSSSWPEYNSVGNCAEGWNALVANQYFEVNTGNWGTHIARVHNGAQCTP